MTRLRRERGSCVAAAALMAFLGIDDSAIIHSSPPARSEQQTHAGRLFQARSGTCQKQGQPGKPKFRGQKSIRHGFYMGRPIADASRCRGKGPLAVP